MTQAEVLQYLKENYPKSFTVIEIAKHLNKMKSSIQLKSGALLKTIRITRDKTIFERSKDSISKETKDDSGEA